MKATLIIWLIMTRIISTKLTLSLFVSLSLLPFTIHKLIKYVTLISHGMTVTNSRNDAGLETLLQTDHLVTTELSSQAPTIC